MAKKNKKTSSLLEAQNAAKTLYANIGFMSPDAPIKSLLITSAVPNEGKTTVALNLAQSIAESGKQVVLVEADMRRRSLADSLNIRSQQGTYSVLVGSAGLDDAIKPTTTRGLYFLDVEPNIPNPADVLSSNSYKKLVHDLEKRFDFVVFDSPPVATFVDAAILSTMVDGVVMVVRVGMTKRATLLEAYDQLAKADANTIGVCATFAKGTGSEYYYAYYNEKGERLQVSHKVNALAADLPKVHAAAAPDSRQAQTQGTSVQTGTPRQNTARGSKAYRGRQPQNISAIKHIPSNLDTRGKR